MSEIEKMYENAGVKPDHYHCEGCEYDYEDICPDDCPNSQAIYPPFTAEKQIELIKWLGLKDDIDYVRYYYKPLTEEWVFEIIYMTEFSNEPPFIATSYEYKFEEGLASLINLIWQDLTSEEKQQVKGILE